VRFDRFLKSYFNHFAFQSITTEQFVAYLKQNLLDKEPALAARVPIDEWINQPGIPASAPQPASPAFARVEEAAKRWLRGELAAAKIPTARWTTQEWLHFLKTVQDEVSTGAVATGSTLTIEWLSWIRHSTSPGPEIPRLLFNGC
jgi:hypothetical protein